ncbi:hypothetical protein SNEBB_011266 [Seison nebaliae]|nr:hypothetical protein SNEBB_011266 [Seison nebaliae]
MKNKKKQIIFISIIVIPLIYHLFRRSSHRNDSSQSISNHAKDFHIIKPNIHCITFSHSLCLYKTIIRIERNSSFDFINFTRKRIDEQKWNNLRINQWFIGQTNNFDDIETTYYGEKTIYQYDTCYCSSPIYINHMVDIQNLITFIDYYRQFNLNCIILQFLMERHNQIRELQHFLRILGDEVNLSKMKIHISFIPTLHFHNLTDILFRQICINEWKFKCKYFIFHQINNFILPTKENNQSYTQFIENALNSRRFASNKCISFEPYIYLKRKETKEIIRNLRKYLFDNQQLKRISFHFTNSLISISTQFGSTLNGQLTNCYDNLLKLSNEYENIEKHSHQHSSAYIGTLYNKEIKFHLPLVHSNNLICQSIGSDITERKRLKSFGKLLVKINFEDFFNYSHQSTTITRNGKRLGFYHVFDDENLNYLNIISVFMINRGNMVDKLTFCFDNEKTLYYYRHLNEDENNQNEIEEIEKENLLVTWSSFLRGDINLEKITQLDISYAKLSYIDDFHLLINLKSINANHNQIRIISKIWPNLEQLYLDHNALNSNDLMDLLEHLKSNFSNLLSLSLVENPFGCRIHSIFSKTCSFRNRIVNFLPTLTILNYTPVTEDERSKADKIMQKISNSNSIDLANQKTTQMTKIGKTKAKIRGKHSEGNRFIKNQHL